MDNIQRIGGKFNLSSGGGRLQVVSSAQRTILYLFGEGSTFLYAVLLQQDDCATTEFFQVSSFLLSSPVESVHSSSDFDCCFCRDGTLYAIPSGDSASSSTETEAFGYDSDNDAEQSNSGGDSPWNIIFVEGTRRLFADRSCCSVTLFRDELVTLVKTPDGWRLNVHESNFGSSRKQFQRQPFVTLDLPCRAAEVGFGFGEPNSSLSPKIHSFPIDFDKSIRVESAHASHGVVQVPPASLKPPAPLQLICNINHIIPDCFVDGARVLSCFQTLSRSEPNFVEPRLLESLFGRELSVQRGHLAFVGAGAGEVFFAFWTSRELEWTRSGPLFCLHQPVLDIWIPSFAEDSERRQHGVACIGQLGKLAVFSSRRDHSEGYDITEFHVPSPVLCSSSFGETIVHSDGSCLWRSVLSFEGDGDACHQLKSMNLGMPGITGIAVWNSEALFLLTEDGRLYLKRGICNWKHASNLSEKRAGASTLVSLGDLLDTIHASSERLSATCGAQEEQRRILRSLSTASHVALNDEVRQTFHVHLSSRWCSDDPVTITFDIRLSNTVNFVLTEEEWHLVVCVGGSASDDNQTKTVPLPGGALTENGVTSIIKFTCSESLLPCTALPLTVTCSLHYQPKQVNSEGWTTAATGTSPDDGQLAFVVPLAEFLVDEISFLRQQRRIGAAEIGRPQRQKELTLVDALLEITEIRRLRLGLPATVPRRRVYPELDRIPNAVTMNLNHVRQFLGGDVSVGEDELLKQLLGHLTRDVIDVDVTGLTQATLAATIFDLEVTIGATVDGSLAKLVVMSECPSLAVGVRRAILRRLGLATEKVDSKTSKDKSEQTSFVVPKSILHNYRALNMDLQEMNLPDLQSEQAVHRLFWETRDSLSCRLPFM